jgi:hypothetical protein
MLGYIGNASAPLPAALAAEEARRLLHRPRGDRERAGAFLFRGRAPDAVRRPSCSPRTRHGEWRRTSPGCRSCCAERTTAPRPQNRPQARSRPRAAFGCGNGRTIAHHVFDQSTLAPGAFCRSSGADRKISRSMPAARCFPPPWSVDESDACFIVCDANGQALACVYSTMRFEANPTITTEEWHG